MITFEQFEKSLTVNNRNKLNNSVEYFRELLIDVGLSSNFLTKIELFAAFSIRAIHFEHLESLKETGDGLPKHFTFKDFVLEVVFVQTGIPISLFSKAIDSVERKGIFGELDFITGDIKLDQA